MLAPMRARLFLLSLVISCHGSLGRDRYRDSHHASLSTANEWNRTTV